MDIIDLLNSHLSDLINNESEKIDLSTTEGYEKYKTLIDELESSVKDNWLLGSIITPEVIENFKTFGKKVYEEAMEKNRKAELDKHKDKHIRP